MLKIEKNINLYYIYSIFVELLIVGPIIVLFFLQKGLTFTEITLLQSVCAISVVLFEVPTGALADRYGKKYCMFLGALMWAIGLSIYIVFNNFYFFILGEIIFGLGMSFKSGAGNALIFETLKNLGREKDFSKVEGRAQSIIFTAQAIGSIVAGFTFVINMYLPLIISIVFMLITSVLSLFFKEPEVNITELKKERYLKQILEGGKYIKNHPKLKAIVLFSTFFIIFLRSSFWLYQPYMESVNIPVEYFGIIFFMFNLVAAAASNNIERFISATKNNTFKILSLFLIASFFLIGFVRFPMGVAFIALQQIGRGLYIPLITKSINKHTISERRATVLSFNSFLGNLLYAVFMPFIGLMLDKSNVFTAHILLGIIMVTTTFMNLKNLKKFMGKKCENVDYQSCVKCQL